MLPFRLTILGNTEQNTQRSTNVCTSVLAQFVGIRHLDALALAQGAQLSAERVVLPGERRDFELHSALASRSKRCCKWFSNGPRARCIRSITLLALVAER